MEILQGMKKYFLNRGATNSKVFFWVGKFQVPLCYAIIGIQNVYIIYIHALVTFSELVSTGFLSKVYFSLLRDTVMQFKQKM